MPIKGKTKPQNKTLFLCFVYGHDNEKLLISVSPFEANEPPKSRVSILDVTFCLINRQCMRSKDNDGLAQAGSLVCFKFIVYSFLNLERDQALLWKGTNDCGIFLNVCPHFIF